MTHFEREAEEAWGDVVTITELGNQLLAQHGVPAAVLDADVRRTATEIAMLLKARGVGPDLGPTTIDGEPVLVAEVMPRAAISGIRLARAAALRSKCGCCATNETLSPPMGTDACGTQPAGAGREARAADRCDGGGA